jgi:deoxycytidine triphosphate deaminase
LITCFSLHEKQFALYQLVAILSIKNYGMLLSKTEIQGLINSAQLLVDYDPDLLQNSSYKLRIGEIIEPEKGKCHNGQTRDYAIKPSEVIIIITKDKIKTPAGIAGSYSALHNLSSQGLLLINASMIEPGYSGHLSCFLVNFSALPILLSHDQEIAKLTFFEVKNPLQPPEFVNIDDDKYKKNLQNLSFKYNRSFLNISRISEQIKKEVTSNARSVILTGGIFLTFLIAFSSFEPLISKWLWEKTGVTSSSEKIRMEIMLKDLVQAKNDLENMSKEKTDINKLQKELDSLKKVVGRNR